MDVKKVKLDDIQAMWSADCKIDQTHLGNAAAKIPELHAKYLNMLSSFKLQRRKAESDLIRMRKDKMRYYRGELSKEELQELGWAQYLGPKTIKGEMEETLAADLDIVKLIDRTEYLATVIGHLESVLKSIHSRTWDVKNAIEWAKFTNGGF